MQTHFRKKSIFLILLVTALIQNSVAQSIINPFQLGDSLFAAGQYKQALDNFEKNLAIDPRPAPVVYLKLAYLHEQLKQDAAALYYLNRYFEHDPSERVLRKMNELATVHDWTGYELNDFNLLVLLYKQFGPYLVGVLLLLGAYVFVVLLMKKLKHQYILPRHKIVFLFYLLGVGVLINLPENYRVAIVRSPQILLRTDPSAAAPIADAIERGNRLSVLGSYDIWLRVVWNNRFAYVRQSDVWLVE
ncbi:MAG: hypothetical protein LH606_12260 [Cytophagaceae bacterium]|nr:hypothetical protein [Cytophagaceae bacterium]